MQEYINEKTVAVSIQATKLTGKVFAKLLKTLARALRNRSAPAGKQSIKSLVRQGAKLENIEINEQGVKSFERTARKYGIAFSLKKDVASETPRYVVFFKAKDVDVMTLAFNEFAQQMLKRAKEKPSILKKLAEFRDKHKGIANPVKRREKGGHEL